MRLAIALTLALLGTVAHAERRAPSRRAITVRDGIANDKFGNIWIGPTTLAGTSSGDLINGNGNGGVMTITGGDKWGSTNVETGRIVNSDAVFTGGQTSFAGGEARFSGGTAQGVARGGDMTFEAGHGFPNGNVVFDNGGPRALIDPQGRFVYRGSEVATIQDIHDATLQMFLSSLAGGLGGYALGMVIIALIRKQRLAAYLARQPEGLDEGPYRHE